MENSKKMRNKIDEDLKILIKFIESFAILKEPLLILSLGPILQRLITIKSSLKTYLR